MSRTITLNATLWGRDKFGDGDDLETADFLAPVLADGCLDLPALFDRAKIAVTLSFHLPRLPYCERLIVAETPTRGSATQIFATLHFRLGRPDEWHVPIASLKPVAERIADRLAA